MADTKVSDFPAVASLLASDIIPVVRPGSPNVSMRARADQVAGNPPVLQCSVGEWLLDPAPSTSTVGQSEQELDLIARFLPGFTFDAVVVNVASAGAAGAVFRVAVYTSLGGKPDQLAAQSAAIDGATAGIKQITLTAPFAVPSGGAITWAGVVCQGGASSRPQFTRSAGTVLNNRIAGTPSVGDLTSSYNANYYTTGVSGAPPSSWTDTRRFDSGARMAFRRSA